MLDCGQYPKIITLSLSNRCNYSCSFCFINSKKNKSVYMKQPIFINKILYFRIVDELRKNSNNTKISFGFTDEPTVHPRIVEFCEYAQKNNIELESLTTNGSLIYKNNHVLSNFFSKFRISVNALSSEKYKIITSNKNSDINRVIDSIDFLRQQNKSVLVSFVKTQINISELENFTKTFLKMGCKVRILNQNYKSSGNRIIDSQQAINTSYFLDKKSCNYCNIPSYHMYVLPNGDVHFCNEIYPLSTVYYEKYKTNVNLQHLTLMEAWNSDYANKMRRFESIHCIECQTKLIHIEQYCVMDLESVGKVIVKKNIFSSTYERES